jgi:prevent-host-death family protein
MPDFMKTVFAEPEIVTKKGKPVSVILPIKNYTEIMERLEDSEDVAWLKKARRKSQHYRPIREVLADLAKR